MDTWDRILSLMAKARVNSKELAQIAGVVPSAVTKWKKGASIRSDALRRIALHFGVSLDDLVGNTSVLPSGGGCTRDAALPWQGPDPPADGEAQAAAYGARCYRSAARRGKAPQMLTTLFHLDQLAAGCQPKWQADRIREILDKHLVEGKDDEP